MTEKKVSRRRFIEIAGGTIVGLAVGAAAGYLVAPGKVVTETKTVTPPTVTVTKTVTPVPTPTPREIFKAANMNAGPAGTQWGIAVLEGERVSEKIIESKFPNIDVVWYNSWNVKPADIKSIIESYIADGVKFIESGDFAQPIYKEIIEAHPDVYFIEPAFTLAETPNAGSYNWDNHIAMFYFGIVAGGVTKTNKIGFVTAFASPYDAWCFNAFREGALRTNPNVEAYYTFTGDYHDVSLGYKAASALIAIGCDFISGNGNGMTNGSIKAAADAGVYSTGIYSDQYDLAPDSVITSSLWNAGKVWSDAISDLIEGVFNHPHYKYTFKDLTVSLAPFRQHEEVVPDYVKGELKKIIELSKAGEFELEENLEFPPELEIK